MSFGEADPGCAAVAAPVSDADDDLVGVLSISGPRHRFDEAMVPVQIAHLLPAAAAPTRGVGGRPIGESAPE